MKLEFANLEELEEFAYTLALGVRIKYDERNVQRVAEAADKFDEARAAAATHTQPEPHAATGKFLDAKLPAGVRLEPIPGDAQDAADMAELYADHPGVLGDDVDPDTIVHEHIDLPPADGTPSESTEPEAEKPKRKRRTKAEMEASARAEQRTLDPAVQATYSDPDTPEAAEELAARELPTVMEHSPAGGQEKLPDVPKDAPNHQASAESLEKHAAAQAEYTPELIETLKGQAELFDANRTDHLKEGREAIAKHGYIKYMATFKGLGLDSGIAAYNDDQVKLHRAAIAHLMAS